MAFIEPMHRYKPNIYYLFTYLVPGKLNGVYVSGFKIQIRTLLSIIIFVMT